MSEQEGEEVLVKESKDPWNWDFRGGVMLAVGVRILGGSGSGGWREK